MRIVVPSRPLIALAACLAAFPGWARAAPRVHAGSAGAAVRAKLDGDGRARAAALTVLGTHAYLVTREDVDGSTRSSLVIVDVSVRDAPRPVGRLDLPYRVNRVAVNDQLAFLATSNPDGELVVVDTAKPDAPRVRAVHDLPGRLDATALAVTASHAANHPRATAWVGTGKSDGPELYVVDVSDPDKATDIASYEIGASVRDLAMRNDTAYVATADPARELIVLDGPEPRKLATRATRDLPGRAGATAVEVELDHVYVTTASPAPTPNFFVLDDAPATSSLPLSSALRLGGNPVDVVAEGKRAYVASPTASKGLSIVELDAGGAHVVGTVDAAPSTAVALGTRDVYLAGAADGPPMVVVDPGAPLAAVGDANGDGLVTVVCSGDSNTMYDLRGTRRGWCELFDDAVSNPNWRFVNRAAMGMTAVDLGRLSQGTPRYVDTPSDSQPMSLDTTLRLDHADVVVLAFGTNDLRATRVSRSATPLELVLAYMLHKAKLERGGVAVVLVALTPPTFPPASSADAAVIAAANALLRRSLPAATLLDFFSGMALEDYGRPGDGDGVHIGTSGQWKRMRTAYRRLVLGD